MSKPPSKIATLLAALSHFPAVVPRTRCVSASRSSAPAPRRRRVPSINTFRCTSSKRRTSNPRVKTPAIGLVSVPVTVITHSNPFAQALEGSPLIRRRFRILPWEMSERLAKVREAQHEEMGNRAGLPHVVADGLYKIHKDSLQKEKQKGPLANEHGSWEISQLSKHLGWLWDILGKDITECIGNQDELGNCIYNDSIVSISCLLNVSSAEKLKLEIEKVRDEFKMSESDCGSPRVQVAQLTTKIKHLSTVLHKKDKHSTRGFLAMVQRRKKLLKYLRRTDWDSYYCLVLSKLGLRDNPDVKA
ncbi:hypothetical protein SASPL_125988 [Salvia splendens]|uniref:Small ribosomal subunit protein uS15c n=1 Tax=Salvia splendens TaxID=180675 RepID=A0A8X8XES7_SALSN|nr:hypothetical protein SASPL_125988 [Salvia splendens]